MNKWSVEISSRVSYISKRYTLSVALHSFEFNLEHLCINWWFWDRWKTKGPQWWGYQITAYMDDTCCGPTKNFIWLWRRWGGDFRHWQQEVFWDESCTVAMWSSAARWSAPSCLSGGTPASKKRSHVQIAYKKIISLELGLSRGEYKIYPLVSSGNVIAYMGSSCVCVYLQNPEITSACLSFLMIREHLM